MYVRPATLPGLIKGLQISFTSDAMVVHHRASNGYATARSGTISGTAEQAAAAGGRCIVTEGSSETVRPAHRLSLRCSWCSSPFRLGPPGVNPQ